MLTLEQFRSNRNVLFWSLHAAGWGAYAITQYFGALLYEKPSSYAQVIVVAAVSGFILSMPMRYIYRRLWGRPPRVMALGVLVTCYITACALRTVINLAYKQIVEPDWQFKTLFELFEGSISTTYLLLLWSALYFGIRSYESQQQQQEAALKAAALAQESQLKMLRYQLNPHFLFNTLNAISTLILDNQNRTANHAISRLSEFLRYTLDQDPMKKVTLRQEIEALDLYLGTERLRFGDRLRLEYAIEEPALEALVPSLLLQPLLENSLKYAISPLGWRSGTRGPLAPPGNPYSRRQHDVTLLLLISRNAHACLHHISAEAPTVKFRRARPDGKPHRAGWLESADLISSPGPSQRAA